MFAELSQCDGETLAIIIGCLLYIIFIFHQIKQRCSGLISGFRMILNLIIAAGISAAPFLIVHNHDFIYQQWLRFDRAWNW